MAARLSSGPLAWVGAASEDGRLPQASDSIVSQLAPGPKSRKPASLHRNGKGLLNRSSFGGLQIEPESLADKWSHSSGRRATSAVFTGLENSSDLHFDRASNIPSSSSSSQTFARTQIQHMKLLSPTMPQKVDAPPEVDEIWERVKAEAREDSDAEPALASYLYSTILAHKSLDRSLAFHLGNKLASSTLLATHLVQLISDSFNEDPAIRHAMRADIRAVKEKDPACRNYSHCLLNFKGFLACQAYRVSHRLWNQGRYALALAIQSRVSEVFHVDIHPAAKIGHGVLFDHATGLVIGETAVVGNNVSILHHVTLGGTGVGNGRRHPTIEDGVLIGAGATILGPLVVGKGAKIGAGSVVLNDIPPHTTAVGSPARLLGGKEHPKKMVETPSETMDHTSFISEWSDYAI